jgi:hypothetical protein
MGTSDPDRPPYASHTYGDVAGLPPPIYPPPPPGFFGLPEHYPAYPYRPVKPPGTNGNAIAALVTSVAGLACCAPVAIVGLIFGVAAMRETKRTGQNGYGLALAGAIIGGLVLAAGLIVMVLYLALMVSNWQWN